jgi:sugar phosphate isomerase/epimerase
MLPSIPRSVSIAGLVIGALSPWGDSPRLMMEWAARSFRFIQLDATLAGIRPRELDRSARRDIAAILRRLQLNLSGVDLWIPPAHFVTPAHMDRAIEAVNSAADFAGELATLNAGARPVVSLQLHPEVSPAVLESLASAADRSGVRIADHQWPRPELAPTIGPVGPGIDPAAIFMAGSDDPAASVSGLGLQIASARLSDVTSAGRTKPGSGRLDLLKYEIALSTAAYASPLILDLRGLTLDAQLAAASQP